MNCQKRVPSFFLLQELQKEIPVSPLAPLAKGSCRAAPERSSPPQRPYGTSPPRSARHLPFTRGGFFTPAPKAPLVKGSWPEGPEGLPRRSGSRAPLPGELAPKATERLSLPGTTSPSRLRRATSPCRGGLQRTLLNSPLTRRNLFFML